MSREKGNLAQAGPASTRAGTPTVSPADTVRTLTLNCPLDRRQPCAHQKTKHTPAGAALANPNTTREGRRHAKWELRRMVRVPFLHRNLTGSYDAALTSRAVGLMCRS